MEFLNLIFSGIGAVGAIGAWIAAYHIYRLMAREAEKASLRQALISPDLQRRAQAVGRIMRCTGDNDKKPHWVNDDIQLATLRLAWISQEKFIEQAGRVWELEGSDKKHLIDVRKELHNYATTFCDQCKPRILSSLDLHTLPAAVIYQGVRALLIHKELNAAPAVANAAAEAERKYPLL